MKIARGMTLVITLIFTSVIAMLVMANLRSQQLSAKISNILKEQQSVYYDLQKGLNHFILTKPWLNTACINQSKPDFSYPIFSNNLAACVWQKYQYVLFEGGDECCIFADSQSAKFYHVFFLNRKNNPDNYLSASIVVRDQEHACQCQSTLHVDEGLLSVQYQRR